jgi:hypothetical protein
MTKQFKAMSLRNALGLFIGVSTVFACQCSVFADSDFIMDTDSVGKTQNNGVVRSDQLLDLGMTSTDTLRLEGEQAMHVGNTDRAIMVLQHSVELEPSDMDGRTMYAQALEKKLLNQKEQDPKLFNFVVKQWLYIAKKSEFPDQQTMAFEQIGKLTGTLPKRWETSSKFLNRVLLPEDGSVKVAIGHKRDSE